MNLNAIDYPLRICVELLHYNTWSNPNTKDMRVSEIKEHMYKFFSESMVSEAMDILRGQLDA